MRTNYRATRKAEAKAAGKDFEPTYSKTTKFWRYEYPVTKTYRENESAHAWARELNEVSKSRN